MADFVIQNVILSFPALFEKKQIAGKGKPCYSVKCLIPKTNTEAVERVRQAIAQVYDTAKDDKLKGVVGVEYVDVPFYDGDKPKKNGTMHGEECKGHWVLNAKSYNRQPGVVDGDYNKVIDPDKVFSGEEAHVDLACYAYKGDESRGITFGLNNVMVLGTGEPLGVTTRSAEDAFAGLGSPNMAAQAGTVHGNIDPFTGQPM